MIESNLKGQRELVVVQMFIAMAVAAKSPNLVQPCFGTPSDYGRRGSTASHDVAKVHVLYRTSIFFSCYPTQMYHQAKHHSHTLALPCRS